MTRKYTVLIEKDEDGWFVSEVLELPGCHTQARDLNKLMERTKEAVKGYLETKKERLSGEFVGVQQLEV